MNADPLFIAAAAARNKAHAPFSGFKVGAAVQSLDGLIYSGCNVESASYGLTMCGRARGRRQGNFGRLPQVHPLWRSSLKPKNSPPPCGACRQVLWELCGNIEVYMINHKKNMVCYMLADLLPAAVRCERPEARRRLPAPAEDATMPAPVQVSTHPLLRHKLAALRSASTPPYVFRGLVYEIAQVLFYEATQDVPLQAITVQTPLQECAAEQLSMKIGFMPVLRAGLGMANAMLDALPEATVWHLGLSTAITRRSKPVTYYNKLPAKPDVGLCLVIDPMLATGGSAVEAIRLLKNAGTPLVKFIGLIAAPEGVAALQAAHPDVPILPCRD